MNQVTLGCTDYAASIAFYTRLGLAQIVDSPPRYARFETPNGETLSLHAVEHLPFPATVIYFEYDDLDAEVARLKAKGLTFASDPEDQRWLWREARLRDPSANEICLYHAGENRRFPPWRIDTTIKDQEC